MFQKISLQIVTVLLVLLLVQPATAAQFAAPPEDQRNLILNGAKDDLYAGGGNVTLESTVTGDLFAAGGAVTISGQVTDDVFAAGGTVSLLEKVGGDARIAAGTAVVRGAVEEDLLIFAGNIALTQDARVGGDLWVAGGSIVVQATVVGNVKIAGGEVLINSTIGGNAEIFAERLSFGRESSVAGRVIYTGPTPPVIEEGAKVPAIDFRQTNVPAPSFTPRLTVSFFIQLFALLAAAFLFVRFFGKTADAVITTAYRAPWKSLGKGLAGIIVIPVAVGLLFLTVIGYYIGLILLAWFFAVMLVTGIVASLFTGSVLLSWIEKRKEVHITWQSVIAGVVLLQLLTWIPVFGWLLALLLFLMVFGGVLHTLRTQIASIHMHGNE